MSETTIPPHVQRMLEELLALQNKYASLVAFTRSDTFEALDPIDRELLVEQSKHMAAYIEVLLARIDRALP